MVPYRFTDTVIMKKQQRLPEGPAGEPVSSTGVSVIKN